MACPVNFIIVPSTSLYEALRLHYRKAEMLTTSWKCDMPKCCCQSRTQYQGSLGCVIGVREAVPLY